MCVCVCVCWGEGGGSGMIGAQCPAKYWAYNFIGGESVCGYGNRSTGN